MNRLTDEHIAPEAATVEAAPKKSAKLSRVVKHVLNGEFLTREEVLNHMPFVLYVCGFFLLSIAIGYNFDNTERKKQKANERLREVSAEYKTLKTQLEARRQQSQVSAEIDALGLEESSTPPLIIEVNLSDLEKQQ
jgi:hypothetical protein